MCLRNSDRVCGRCKERNVAQVPLKIYLMDYGTKWYGNVDALRKLANGCPLCMLAAKMNADDFYPDYERWRDFDYQKEVDRDIEEHKDPNEIPF